MELSMDDVIEQLSERGQLEWDLAAAKALNVKFGQALVAADARIKELEATDGDDSSH